MTKVDDRVAELLAKHPNLTKPEALKIVTDKNERKKNRRAEKAERSQAKQRRNEADRPKD